MKLWNSPSVYVIVVQFSITNLNGVSTNAFIYSFHKCVYSSVIYVYIYDFILVPHVVWKQTTDDIFKYIFLGKNVLILIKISLKFVPQGSNWQNCSIGSDNGLAPNRWQAIIWTDDNLCCRRIYAYMRHMASVSEHGLCIKTLTYLQILISIYMYMSKPDNYNWYRCANGHSIKNDDNNNIC